MEKRASLPTSLMDGIGMKPFECENECDSMLMSMEEARATSLRREGSGHTALLREVVAVGVGSREDATILILLALVVQDVLE